MLCRNLICRAEPSKIKTSKLVKLSNSRRNVTSTLNKAKKVIRLPFFFFFFLILNFEMITSTYLGSSFFYQDDNLVIQVYLDLGKASTGTAIGCLHSYYRSHRHNASSKSLDEGILASSNLCNL